MMAHYSFLISGKVLIQSQDSVAELNVINSWETPIVSGQGAQNLTQRERNSGLKNKRPEHSWPPELGF